MLDYRETRYLSREYRRAIAQILREERQAGRR